MKAVAGFMGRDSADEGPAEEGQVTRKVEELVADELVRKPKRRVDDPFFVENDGVVVGRPQGYALSTKPVDVFQEAKSPGRSDVPGEFRPGQGEGPALCSDPGMVINYCIR